MLYFSMTYTYCCMYSARLLMMDTNGPKRVEFYSKNEFEKLVHLVGVIIRIYHDARSSECQIKKKNIIAFSVIKTHDPNNQGAADQRLGLHGCRYRLQFAG